MRPCPGGISVWAGRSWVSREMPACAWEPGLPRPPDRPSPTALRAGVDADVTQTLELNAQCSVLLTMLM